jgi:hypothetical protein
MRIVATVATAATVAIVVTVTVVVMRVAVAVAVVVLVTVDPVGTCMCFFLAPKASSDADAPYSSCWLLRWRGFKLNSEREEQESLPVPDAPPFKAMVRNLPYSATKDDVEEFFQAMTVRMSHVTPWGGNMRKVFHVQR